MRGNIVLVPSDGLQMVRLERWTRVRGLRGFSSCFLRAACRALSAVVGRGLALSKTLHLPSGSPYSRERQVRSLLPEWCS